MMSNIPFDWLVWVSPTSFLWNLTLFQLNPGRYPPLMLCYLLHAQYPHFLIYHHHFFCLFIYIYICMHIYTHTHTHRQILFL